MLTELDDAFVIRAETEAGQQILDRLKLQAASTEQVQEGQERVADAAKKMGRTLDTQAVRELLQKNWNIHAGMKLRADVWPVRIARWSAQPVSATVCRTSPI